MLGGAYPDDPGVHGAEHGAFAQHGLAHLVHVVQQPAQLHGAEVGADGEARLVLEAKRQQTRLKCFRLFLKNKQKVSSCGTNEGIVHSRPVQYLY